MHNFNFVRNFCATENGNERTIRIRYRFSEISEFLFHQQARRGLANKFGDADNGGMRAMRGTKCVADEKLVAQLR